MDALAGIAATLPIREAIMLSVQLQATPSIIPGPVCSANEADLGWIQNIMKYLKMGELLEKREVGAQTLCIGCHLHSHQ